MPWCATAAASLPPQIVPQAAMRPSPPCAGDQWRINFSRVQWRVRWDDAAGVYVKDPPDQREDNWVGVEEWKSGSVDMCIWCAYCRAKGGGVDESRTRRTCQQLLVNRVCLGSKAVLKFELDLLNAFKVAPLVPGCSHVCLDQPDEQEF
eukprot:357321-Chlamydomonas_euryale.AAC.3